MSDQRPSRTRLDPAVDMMRRIERLERTDAHPESTLGLTTETVGEVEPTDFNTEGFGWSATVVASKFFITADDDVSIGEGLT